MMSTSFSLAEIFLLIFLNIADKKTRMSSRYENDKNNKRNEINFKWLLMVKTDTSPFPPNTTWFTTPPPPTRNPTLPVIRWHGYWLSQVLKQYAAEIWIIYMLKLASLWCTPDWEPWNANQSMIVELLSMPRPPFTRQALKSFVVTSSTQINLDHGQHGTRFRGWSKQINERAIRA